MYFHVNQVLSLFGSNSGAFLSMQRYIDFLLHVHAFLNKKISSWLFKKENKEASLICLSSQVPSLMKLLV